MVVLKSLPLPELPSTALNAKYVHIVMSICYRFHGCKILLEVNMLSLRRYLVRTLPKLLQAWEQKADVHQHCRRSSSIYTLTLGVRHRTNQSSMSHDFETFRISISNIMPIVIRHASGRGVWQHTMVLNHLIYIIYFFGARGNYALPALPV